ncbi:MAG: hypothetical protein AB8B49_04195 [Nitratireductor sp.]
MPQLIALGLVGGLVWYGYRELKKHMAVVQDELKKTTKDKTNSKKSMKVIDDLEQGSDGVYRPKDESTKNK